MKPLIDAALGHARTVLACLVLVLIAGGYAYRTVPKEAEPDIDIPVIYVNVHHEGISPEDAERLIIKPLEEQLRNIEGIKEMIAEGYEGGASVMIEFEAGIDTDKALQDVRDKVAAIEQQLPDGIEPPIVQKFDIGASPVLSPSPPLCEPPTHSAL